MIRPMVAKNRNDSPEPFDQDLSDAIGDLVKTLGGPGTVAEALSGISSASDLTPFAVKKWRVRGIAAKWHMPLARLLAMKRGLSEEELEPERIKPGVAKVVYQDMVALYDMSLEGRHQTT